MRVPCYPEGFVFVKSEKHWREVYKFGRPLGFPDSKVASFKGVDFFKKLASSGVVH